MEPNPDELLSALKDAEEFISGTLLKESLTHETETKRQKLETTLRNLINKSNGKNSEPLPPRPPKSAPNETKEEDEDCEDLYDDVGTGFIEVKEEVSDDHPVSQSGVTMGIQGISKESQDNMNNKEVQEDTYDDTVNATSEENYEEPGKDDSAEELDYEVAEPQKQAEGETDDVYEGIDAGDGEEDKTGDESLEERRERSGTEELEMLTNPVKAADVEDIIYKGFLDKHRKRGKLYIGNKWQKRFCVVRTFAMYYFTNQNADRQKGTVLLPGYKVSVNKQSKSNREFILTRDKDRSYTFQAESKDEMVKWMDAIQKAASGKISKRQSEILDGFRSESLDADEDSASIINYDDVSTKDGSINGGVGEIYDDVNENEDSGSGNIDYEISQEETSNKSQNDSTTMEGSEAKEEVYEIPGDESDPEPPPPVQPPRPVVTEQIPPSMPVKPPEIPPTTVEEEELYDDVGVELTVPEDVPQSSTKPQIPERNIPLPTPPSDNGKPSPVLPRPALPPTPGGEPKPIIPPRREGALPSEPGKETTPASGKAPLPPPPEENAIPVKAPPNPPPEENAIPDKAPPNPPPEEETEDQVIDYASIYQALWDCKPDADDELEFCRGDLIYIYEKPHSDWWIGSRYKPQGYETRLIPRNYLTEAYE